VASCVFCQLLSGEIEGDILYQDDEVAAFRDINPQAPVHILVVPRRHIPSLAEVGSPEESLMGKLLLTAARMARQEGLEDDGFRVVINTGDDGGQTVDHLHVHVLGGRGMGWPPG